MNSTSDILSSLVPLSWFDVKQLPPISSADKYLPVDMHFIQLERLHPFIGLAGPALLIISLIFLAVRFTRTNVHGNALPVVNRNFMIEPAVFRRWRWALNAKEILDDAWIKFGDRPYILARGDADFTVLPPRYIPELNRLQSKTSSRMSHSFTLLGHLNGMDIVLETALHVKIIQSRLTPMLGNLVAPVSSRIQDDLMQIFPQTTTSMARTEPFTKIVHSVSHAIAFALLGTPTCDDPEFVKLLPQHTTNMFAVGFAMRFAPALVQPYLAWLMPDRWRLRRSWKQLRDYVLVEVDRRKSEQLEKTATQSTDFITQILQETKNEREVDPTFLTRIVGAVVAGATWSTAASIVGTLINLVARPQDLEHIREEIRMVHEEVKGKWDVDAFNKLDKLDSALKETLRLAPGSMLIYSRKVVADLHLSDGTFIKKNDFLCVSGHSRAHDPAWFPNPHDYQALRAYNKDLQNHRNHPFQSVDNEEFRWGAGRWACPGRHFASFLAKIMLVKLLDEYEYEFAGHKRPSASTIHEFVFIHPSTPIMMRRREKNSGIDYELMQE